MFEAVLFYFFAFIILISSIMVISSRNPVHSVLFLIFAFFNSAALFLMLGAEFIAMMLVVVYVGAVAVLFLFVVMMLDIKISEIKKGFQKYLPFGITIGLILLIELIIVLNSDFSNIQINQKSNTLMSNTHLIGSILYTDYILLFQISGLILLVAMIGAIILTLRKREGVKKQNISNQNIRSHDQVIEVVKVKSNDGSAYD
tara:strand:+ start:432 stop:1034 length:603 start_codon:yes stop_codon:yes gene_type:complete